MLQQPIMNLKKLSVKQINYGIACRIGDTIYINEKIKSYSEELYKAILSHELEHTSGWSWKDLAIDIDINQLKGLKKRYYGFILSNPGSWIEFLPLAKYDNRYVWNPLILGAWIIIGGLLWLISYFIR